MASLFLKPDSIEDYRSFLRARQCPVYSVRGHLVTVPDEYAWWLRDRADGIATDYVPSDLLFDYQRDIAATAIRKKQYAVFADCGLGKTLILLEFARHVWRTRGGRVLIVSPLMVVPQTIAESERFYADMPIEQVRANELQRWLSEGDGIAITNYDAMTQELQSSGLSGLIIDESSSLKSSYGKWGQTILRIGKGVEYKLCLTGTPAPNDRIEYANHAVFLGASKTVNEFLAKYFVNRGQTDNRWELKPHALGPFYRDLSHWCIFLTNPATYGWTDNTEQLPPIEVHIEHIEMLAEQVEAVQSLTGGLFADKPGGITERAQLARIGKGSHNGKAIPTNKPEHIRKLVESFGTESTIIWCIYNDEQDALAELFPDAANIDGSTPYEKRIELIDDFKSGSRRVMISKPKILGFGLNLQRCTRMIFSGLQDSYESYYQAVKRANRYGATKPLHVHIPVTDIEYPMIETVLRKAARVQADTEEQERIFREKGFTR